MFKRFRFIGIIVAMLCGLTQTVEAKKMRDQQALMLLNNVFQALQISDFDQSVQASLPYLHRSLLNESGTDITADLRRFGFKKAHEGIAHYAFPVQVKRVRKTGLSAVGFGSTAEEGDVYDYFVEKNTHSSGQPAPVKVFFPKSGQAPKIYYLGSI